MVSCFNIGLYYREGKRRYSLCLFTSRSKQAWWIHICFENIHLECWLSTEVLKAVKQVKKLDAYQKCISLLANNIPYVLCNCILMLSLLRLMYCATVTLKIISTVSSDYKTTSITASGLPQNTSKLNYVALCLNDSIIKMLFADI